MKIICIGRNYAAHSKELETMLGNAAQPSEEPVWFLKPETALLCNNADFPLPGFSREVHYECELVVSVCREGKDIPESAAPLFYREVGLGIDFTARDLQRKAAAEGNPWEPGKAFDHSAAVSPLFLSLDRLGKGIQELEFVLEIDGCVRQRGHTADMLYPVNRVISVVSRYMTLKPGDLIYTGTPVGAGPVYAGEHLEAFLEGHRMLDFVIL